MNITIMRGERPTGPQMSATCDDPSFVIAVKIVDEDEADAFRRLSQATAEFVAEYLERKRERLAAL